MRSFWQLPLLLPAAGIPSFSSEHPDVLESLHCGKCESRSVVSYSLRPRGLYSPCNSPGQNIGVNSGSLLQGIFPTQGSNPGLPHCRQILYQLSHQGSPHFTYKWAVMDDQGLRLSSSSFLCLSKREKGKGTPLYRGGYHQSEPHHSECEAIWKYKQGQRA